MAKQRQYHIQGTITNQAGVPIAGLTLQATDLDPNTPENVLGKPVLTNTEEQFLIHYAEADFHVPKKSRGADINLRVYDSDGNLLKRSKPLYLKTVTLTTKPNHHG